MPSHINDTTPEGNMLAKALVELHQKVDGLTGKHAETTGAIAEQIGEIAAAVPKLLKLADDVSTLVAAIRQAVPTPPPAASDTAAAKDE